MKLEYLLLATMLIPLAGALIISRLDSKPNVREAVTLITAVSLFAVVLVLYCGFSDAKTIEWTIAEPFPGMPIRFQLDELGMLFALVASSLWIVTSIYAIGYMRAHHEKNQTRFYTWFAVSIAAVMALALSDNLFTLFVFYEVLTLSTYPLVTPRRY